MQEIQKLQAAHLAGRKKQEERESIEPDTAQARTQPNPYSYCNGFCANMSLAVVVLVFGFLVHTVMQSVS